MDPQPLKKRCCGLLSFLFFMSVALDAAAATTKLRIILEPNESFNEIDGDESSLKFGVVSPESGRGSCDENAICSGTIVVNDMSAVDEVEFIFRAPQGKELHLVSGEDNQILIEFQGLTDAACNGDTVVEGDALTPPTVTGSDTDDLAVNYQSEDSFFLAGKCERFCGSCEIFTRIHFSSDSFFSGTIQEIRWSVPLEASIFANATNAEFYYHTGEYSWILTPQEGAIVDTSLTRAPTVAPTAPPSTSPAPSTTQDNVASTAFVHSVMTASTATLLLISYFCGVL